MESVLAFLAGGSTLAYLLVGAFAAVALVTICLYVTAFFQGREISFWPPRLGAHRREEKPSPDGVAPPANASPGPVWVVNSRTVDERSHWIEASSLIVGVQYSPKFFKDFFDVIEARSANCLATLVLVLEPDGAATRYLKETRTGTAQVAEGVLEIERMIREADAGRGYARVKRHDRLMRYSFIRTEKQIWVKFFTNGAHRAIVPAVKIECGSALYAFFEEDVRKLEEASHD